MSANDLADANIIVDKDAAWMEQETAILNKLRGLLDNSQLDAVICVAGGWAGGNANKDLAKNAELMWKQSVWSSTISATISSHFLKQGGVLTLTGADAALNGTQKFVISKYYVFRVIIFQFLKKRHSWYDWLWAC